MRLYKYLALSSRDDDVSRFRSLKVDLVESDTGNVELVKRIAEKGMLDDSVLVLLERANRELKKLYRGKFKFDLCLDEGMSPDEVKMDSQKVKQLKEKWFQFNDELSQIQINFEKSLKKVDKQR